jgi:hypothetical protein
VSSHQTWTIQRQVGAIFLSLPNAGFLGKIEKTLGAYISVYFFDLGNTCIINFNFPELIVHH